MTLFSLVSVCAQAQELINPSDVYQGDPVKFIPISNSSITFFVPVFDDSIPQDPGEEGKATVAGIDSDNDGVRDDIERYISLAYDSDPAVRDSLYQFAAAQQSAIIRTVEPAQDINLMLIKARSCVTISAGEQAAEKAIVDLISKTLNTYKRSKAYAANLETYLSNINEMGGRNIQCN
ncbi:hypothetical protein [Microbulbifer yueqingensis]|uniref:hypothetical protein n=1 Tax=Microbulbifer yueqingensis TaxID=658219 RepID=UPI00158766B1|nr:hypothetical protein [Microbulbifer yueqingensis]